MSPPRSSAVAALALFLGATAVRADAILDVSGSVVSASPRLEVRVVVKNRGDRASGPVDVTGEWLGQEREARLDAGLAAGAEGAVVLDYDASAALSGLHALTLLLEHPLDGARDAAGNPPVASARAWLLLALGTNPGPAVRVQALPALIDVRGTLDATLESVDGAPHRVRLRALAARGLRVEGEPAIVAVPPHGVAQARVSLVRAGAARGSRHAILLVAETLDDPPLRTSVATAPVDVAADPSLLPRLRRPLAALGFLLLALALAAEAWRWWAARRQAA